MRIDKDLLKIARAKKDLSKVEVSKKSGVDRKKYSRYEEDPGKCTLKELVDLSAALDFDPTKIFLK